MEKVSPFEGPGARDLDLIRSIITDNTGGGRICSFRVSDDPTSAPSVGALPQITVELTEVGGNPHLTQHHLRLKGKVVSCTGHHAILQDGVDVTIPGTHLDITYGPKERTGHIDSAEIGSCSGNCTHCHCQAPDERP